jgi:GDP-L-fucose synthase
MNIIFGKNGFVGSNLDINCLSPSRQECDLSCYQSTKKYLSNFINVDICIINLAAKVAGVIYNQDHNVEMLYENTLSSLNLIKAIKELNLKCYYLSVSSVCAYDSSFEIEESNFFNSLPQESNFGYGISKRISYLAPKALQLDNKDFKFGCLIPTNMYGPNDEIDLKYSHVIPSLFIKMIYHQEREVEVHGNCLNVRNFLYVKDLCKSIEFFVKNKVEGYYNISSNDEISIYDLSEKIKNVTKTDKIIKYSEVGRIEKRYIKNEKLKNAYLKLNSTFETTNLDDGLLETYTWIKSIQK